MEKSARRPVRLRVTHRARVGLGLGVVLLALGVGDAAPAVAAADGAGQPSFDETWRDGRAELDGYRLTVDRYGHPRVGRGVAIYVTEPLSRTKHVKLDEPAKAAPADVLDVLKLNLVRSFQTGIYDYHTMVSLFVDAADFAPVKVAFSSAEWCGQVYEQLDFDDGRLAARYASYFEGESAEQTVEVPDRLMTEDALFVVLRGLRGPFLAPGEKRELPFLASPFVRRLAHRPLAVGKATIERRGDTESVTVPAGTFVADVFVVTPDDGREGRFWIERAAPHRVLRWAWTRTGSGGAGQAGLGGTDAGELTGTSREPYWKEHDPGDEKLLERLGLKAVVE